MKPLYLKRITASGEEEVEYIGDKGADHVPHFHSTLLDYVLDAVHTTGVIRLETSEDERFEYVLTEVNP